MIAKLVIDEIAEFWPSMRKALMLIYKDSDKLLGQIDGLLNHLLEGDMQAWTMVDGKDIVGFMITQVSIDDYHQEKNLMVRELYTLNGMSEGIWNEGFADLSRFASGVGCSNIIGFTSNPKMAERCRKLGCETELIMFKKEV